MCDECTSTFVVLHGINEVLVECRECSASNSMRKLLSTPILVKDENTLKENKVGELTKEYIEINRQILIDERRKTKEETHESS